MTRDEVIRLAKEAGLSNEIGVFGYPYLPELERFAAAIATAEREACVEVCDNLIGHGIVSEVQLRYNKAYEHCKDAIRARGDK